nr:PREDICTED: zinc finger and BTB domain-containing protein 14 [Opisthocomus hoazin]
MILNKILEIGVSREDVCPFWHRRKLRALFQHWEGCYGKHMLQGASAPCQSASVLACSPALSGGLDRPSLLTLGDSYRTFPMHRAFLHREFNSDYLRYSRTWPQIRSVSILRQALPSQSRNSEHDDMKRRNLLVGTEFFISMSETIKYNDDDHKTVFLKTLNEQRLEGEFCDIAIVVEDVKFRAHRCVLAACSTYFKKLFKKLEVDSSSVIEIDFLRSDIFEEVLNYMYTAKISVKKEDVNLMMSSGQILGIRFLDKLCSQKRDVSSPEENTQSKSKYCLKINRPMGEPNDTQDDEVEEIGDHDDSPSDVTVEGTPPSQEDGKSPTTTLRVQEAILKELGSEEVRKVNCYGQEVEPMETTESKDLGSQTPQALTFNDGISEVKDEQTPGWTTAAGDMKFEYLLYGHREHIVCQACGKTFSDEARLRKHEKLHTADRPFVCEMCTKGFTTQAHLKEHLKIHTGYKPYSCEVCGKSFIRAPDLKKHERVHSNERPFACHMCDKAFKHKSHLKDHERRHRGEKPFVCSSCTKAFAKASDLKRHENNMHSERKQVTAANSIQSETEQLQAAAMAAEAEQQLETIACS